MGVLIMAEDRYTDWDAAPVLLTTKQACALLQLNINTLKKLLHAGTIPGGRQITTRGDWRIDRDVLRKWFEDSGQE